MSADEVPEPQPTSVEGSAPNDDNMVRTSAGGGNKKAYVTVFVLFVINLLNYMDRQTIAGMNMYFCRKISIQIRKSGEFMKIKLSASKITLHMSLQVSMDACKLLLCVQHI